MSKGNVYDTREAWLRAAVDLLRDYFKEAKYELPAADMFRLAIAFTSAGRKGNRVGECWHPMATADGRFEIIIRADKADPLEVLCILFHELIHAVLPADAGHGESFKVATRKLSFDGPMRHAMPNKWLRGELAAKLPNLGPLPHAELFIAKGADGKAETRAADRPKRQKNRYLKAHCEAEGCAYWVRLVASCIEIGAPGCPVHGQMIVDQPAGAGDGEED